MVMAVGISEALVSFEKTTWCIIPEGSCLHTNCELNLKSHVLLFLSVGTVVLNLPAGSFGEE
jgi:hypothetical protein